MDLIKAIDICIFKAITVKINQEVMAVFIDYRQVGQRIKSMRKANRMTQEDLAERLQVSVGYVSQVERGITKISLDLLAAIATVLDGEIAYFLDGVTVEQKNYLEAALQSHINRLTPEKKRLLLKIVTALAEEP